MTRPALGTEAARRTRRSGPSGEEGRRLQYVAMTRARQHLIVSGGMSSRADDDTPMARALPDAGASAWTSEGRGRGGPAPGRRDGWCVPEPAPAGPTTRPTSCICSRALQTPLPDLAAAGRAAAAARRVRCGASPTAGWRCTTAAATASTRSGCCACPSGSARRPGRGHGRGRDRRRRAPAAGARRRRAGGERYPHATAEDEARIERMLASWRRLGAGRARGRPGDVRAELPFVFASTARCSAGRFDLYHRDADGRGAGGRLQDQPAGRDAAGRPRRAQLPPPGRRSTRWRRCWARRRSVEVVYAFLDRPGRDRHAQRYGADDLDTLRGRRPRAR